MTRVTLETGSNGIQLQLEYGSIVDAATGGAITADTASVKFNNLEAWIDGNGYPFYDSSNKLTASGGWVNDDSWSNIDIPTTSGTRKLKELGCQAQATVFGSTNGSYAVSLEITGINAAGTMNGSKSWTVPRRPYHAPNTPGVSIDGANAYVSGHQRNAAADNYWATLWHALETNDVWAASYTVAPDSTYVAYAAAADSRYRAAFAAGNQDVGGASGYSGYYYTAPAAPSVLAAARQATKTSVLLTWTNNARYVGAYLIERSLDGGAYSQIGSSGSASFTDTSVPLGSTASYRVRVQSPTGANTAYSAYSAVAAVTYGWAVPDAPASANLVRLTDATATAGISGNQTNSAVDKYWSSVTGEVQTDAGAFVVSHNAVANTTTSFSLSGLSANKRYCFRAKSTNPAGSSAYRTSGFIYTTPLAPTDFVAARESSASSTVLLSWTNPAAWVDLWIVERSTNGVDWIQLGTTATPNYTDTLSVAATAQYRVRAQTPAPAVQSANTAAVTVGFALISDKAKMPGVDHIYVGEERIRRVLVGTTAIWTDGDA